MFKRDHVKTKIIAFIILNLLLCAVFFVLPSIEAEKHSYTGFNGIAEVLIIYPSLSAIYGAMLAFTYHKDYAFVCMMGVTFFTCSLANTFLYNIIEPPAAFIYTGIMVAFVLLVRFIYIGMRALRKSYCCIYKEKSKNYSK